MTDIGDGTYDLVISGSWVEGAQVNVAVGKTGYAFEPTFRPVTLHDVLDVTVAFGSVAADGSAGSAKTTTLTLTLDQVVPGLTAEDIKLSGGTGVASLTAGELTGNGDGTYSLVINSA